MHKRKNSQDPNQLEMPIVPPRVIVPTVTIPNADGKSWTIKYGTPKVLGQEIGTKEAAEILGLSQTAVQHDCDMGMFKSAHKPSGKKSGKWLLDRAEVEARKLGTPYPPVQTLETAKTKAAQ